MLPDWKGEKLMGKFRKHIKYDDICTGELHYNAMHDKYVYEADYHDGTTEQLIARIIAENMISQVDSEGRHYQVLTGVTEHSRYDSAITKVNGFIKYSNGNLHQNSTDNVWKLLVECKYGLVDWVTLKELKQSNPVQLAEYAMSNEISDEPKFSWWIKETLSCWDRIISKINPSVGAHHISLGY